MEIHDTAERPTYEELEFQLKDANEKIRVLKQEISQLKFSKESLISDENVLNFTGFPKRSILQKVF